MASAGKLINRGPKYRSDLKFLNSTNKQAILVEVVFVDSSTDGDLYRANFDDPAAALAEAIVGENIDVAPTPPKPVEPVEPGAPEPEPLPPEPADRRQLLRVIKVRPSRAWRFQSVIIRW